MECISKDKALKKLLMQQLDLEADMDKGEYSELCENKGAREAIEEAISEIKAIPAEDVQPVKFARWIDLDKRILCSGCGAGYDDSDEVKLNTYIFCPNCGARMDGNTE